MKKDIYVFSDWSAASRMKSSSHPERSVDTSISNDKCTVITVREKEEILVRFSINSQNVWSLSDEEAVELLCSYGFTCRYEPKIEISSRVLNLLRSASTLGATHVTRFLRPCAEVVMDKKILGESTITTSGGCTYTDWLFMTPGVTYSIEKILKEGKSGHK